MPVYSTKSGYRIMFDFNGHSYSKRLDKTYTKAQADALEIKWKHDLMFEAFGVEKRKDILFEDFVADYFLPFAESHYSSEGYANVIIICKSALPFLKGISLRKITVADLEKFKRFRENLETKHKTKRKPATIHREFNIISKIFSEAVKHDYLDYNPCAKVDLPRVRNLQDKILPVDKLVLFLENIHSPLARDVALLILNTGLRQNDALGLKKFQVDFENRFIRLVQGKSKAEVKIPLNETAFEILERRKAKGSEFFFVNPKTGLPVKSVKRTFIRASERAKLGNISTKVLRRTFATALAENNYSPSAIAKLLGHSDLRSVHRYQRESSILRDAVDSIKMPDLAAILPPTLKLVKNKPVSRKKSGS